LQSHVASLEGQPLFLKKIILKKIPKPNMDKVGRNQEDPISDDVLFKELVKPLFDAGMKNKEIISNLKNVQKVDFSLSSLKLRLKKWKWYRSRKSEPPPRTYIGTYKPRDYQCEP
jgi:hypothetical protein